MPSRAVDSAGQWWSVCLILESCTDHRLQTVLSETNRGDKKTLLACGLHQLHSRYPACLPPETSTRPTIIGPSSYPLFFAFLCTSGTFLSDFIERWYVVLICRRVFERT